MEPREESKVAREYCQRLLRMSSDTQEYLIYLGCQLDAGWIRRDRMCHFGRTEMFYNDDRTYTREALRCQPARIGTVGRENELTNQRLDGSWAHPFACSS